MLKEYEEDIKDADFKAGEQISDVLESQMGVHAMHPGTAPGDWVKPGGMPEMGYRSGMEGMMENSDVVKKKELKKFKVSREYDLRERSINMTNHCRTHKCSAYCLRKKKKKVKFDPKKHADMIGNVVRDKNENEYVYVDLMYCRMDFGEELKYDPSGGNDRTRGKPSLLRGEISFDKNGMPRYHAKRNHPRVLQQPYNFFWWGCNNDTQKLLVGNALYERVTGRGQSYEEYVRKLIVAGRLGLESYTAIENIEEYLVGYFCKGAKSSMEWDTTLRSVVENMIKRGKGDKDLFSVVGSMMNSITKSKSFTRDEASYFLGGGVHKRTSLPVKKIFVGNINLDDIAPQDVDINGQNSEEGKKAASWSNIVKRYKDRSTCDEELNVYKFIVLKMFKKEKFAPQFIGFKQVAKWPLEEVYSKWMLAIYKPWRGSIDSLKLDGSFSKQLVHYMWDRNIPLRITLDIVRRKYSFKYDLSETNIFNGEFAHTPTDEMERQNAEHDEAVELNLNHAELDWDDDDYGDLSESDFDSLYDGGNEKDWSEGYDEKYESWLDEYTTKFYSDLNNALHDDSGVTLYMEDVYRPENCRGKAQKLIVGTHLLQHKKWMEYYNSPSDVPLPPSLHVKCQGKPGTGKSFIIMTLRNITRKMLKSNFADGVCAPTGCASSLISGMTMYRLFKIPTAKDTLYNVPKDRSCSNPFEFKYWVTMWQRMFLLIMDEDSMAGRPIWAWLEHRSQEGRRFLQQSENTSPSLYVSREQSIRPWGGIPCVFSFGDCFQLPPVGMKGIHSMKQADREDSSDFVGKLSFHNFLRRDPDSGTISLVVLMDEVLRQQDNEFLNVLDAMRCGAMQECHVNFLLSRLLQDMPDDELRTFEKALHIMPTWKQAIPIVVEYLRSLNTPIARIFAQYSSKKGTKRNHCVSECSYPSLSGLGVGASVMLLKNYIPDVFIVNGSIGIVKKIVYKSKEGPRNRNNLPAYVLVDFPATKIPRNDKCSMEYPSTTFSVAPHTFLCEKKCCSMTTLPLRVCKAISIHKCQGISVGNGHDWEKVVITLPTCDQIITPGMELVAVSRVIDKTNFAINSSSTTFSKHDLKRIGRGPSTNERLKYIAELENLAALTQPLFEEEIAQCDVGGRHTFDGGFDELVRWYRSVT